MRWIFRLFDERKEQLRREELIDKKLVNTTCDSILVNFFLTQREYNRYLTLQLEHIPLHKLPYHARENAKRINSNLSRLETSLDLCYTLNKLKKEMKKEMKKEIEKEMKLKEKN